MAKQKGSKGKEVDWAFVDRALGDMMTGTQIAAALYIDPKTLKNKCLKEKKMTFEEYRDQIRAGTLQKLANTQLRAAFGYQYEVQINTTREKTQKGGNVVEHTVKTTKQVRVLPDAKLLIHLGVQYLNQHPAHHPKPGSGDKSNANFVGYIIEDENGNVIEDLTELDEDERAPDS